MKEMAENGSREQFGALRKVLQPGEPAVCLTGGWGPHIWSCPVPLPPTRAPGKVSKGTPRASAGRGERFQKTHCFEVFTLGLGCRRDRAEKLPEIN